VPGRPREFDSSLCFLDLSASKNLDYDDVVLSLRDDQVSSGRIRNAFNRRSVYICKLRYVARYHVIELPTKRQTRREAGAQCYGPLLRGGSRAAGRSSMDPPKYSSIVPLEVLATFW
jgi:hypothetical protein